MSDKLKTLSQAIRLGATFRPQCRYRLFDGESTCAIGAAYEATFGTIQQMDSGEAFTSLMDRFNVPFRIMEQAAFLNDGYHGANFEPCTREEVADWVEAQGY